MEFHDGLHWWDHISSCVIPQPLLLLQKNVTSLFFLLSSCLSLCPGGSQSCPDLLSQTIQAIRTRRGTANDRPLHWIHRGSYSPWAHSHTAAHFQWFPKHLNLLPTLSTHLPANITISLLLRMPVLVLGGPRLLMSNLEVQYTRFPQIWVFQRQTVLVSSKQTLLTLYHLRQCPWHIQTRLF